VRADRGIGRGEEDVAAVFERCRGDNLFRGGAFPPNAVFRRESADVTAWKSDWWSASI
jgi:hypothetical protein